MVVVVILVVLVRVMVVVALVVVVSVVVGVASSPKGVALKRAYLAPLLAQIFVGFFVEPARKKRDVDSQGRVKASSEGSVSVALP